jgi:hypothetical protein
MAIRRAEGGIVDDGGDVVLIPRPLNVAVKIYMEASWMSGS